MIRRIVRQQDKTAWGDAHLGRSMVQVDMRNLMHKRGRSASAALRRIEHDQMNTVFDEAHAGPAIWIMHEQLPHVHIGQRKILGFKY
ncbi:hypothetical protein MC45_14325 [Sphingomonas taxi]|uniref:Uncharacterized protein n=1 Tax=Sphingomonas taxi TaxID=1549858 RepID=A0A097EIH4_9SPHN|nr:hypothetical protein MC45_14325 [Sphingomonas taxi]